MSQICRERGSKDTLYYKWRDIFIERDPMIFESKRNAAQKEKEDRVAELPGSGMTISGWVKRTSAGL